MWIKILNIFLLHFFCLLLHGQVAVNIYDQVHTQQFADYLYNSGQFEYATEEYQRLLFALPNQQNNLFKLMKCYQKIGTAKMGIKVFGLLSIDPLNFSEIVGEEYLKLLLLSKDYPTAQVYIQQHDQMKTSAKQLWTQKSYLLSQNWEAVDEQLPALSAILLQRQEVEQSLKKTYVAVGMSGVVPGLGKVYAKSWKDGIISFLFVGINAFQSYRNFDRRGAKSILGWIHGGLALGFYVGNLYGSHKAVLQYNQKRKDELDTKIYKFVFPDL